jgi:hypothetical protein
MTHVPESRRCGRGCCYTSGLEVSARYYKCRCHTIRHDTAKAARLRLEDFLDSLGDE